MSIYQQQREEIRHNILSTSVSIFREKGYESTTIDEITRKVGVAKGTFYNFFTSKSDILIAWAVDKFQTFSLQEAMNNSRSLEENLILLAKILHDAMKEEEPLFRSFLREILSTGKKHNSEFNFIEIFHQIINNSTDAQRINNSMADVKIDVLNHSLFMGIVSWFDTRSTTDGLYEYLVQTIKICLYGMLSDQ